MRKTKIKTIDVTALEWFDKTYGNSYFAGTVTVNYGMKSEREYKMLFQYGYGDSYIDHASDLLRKENEKITFNGYRLSMACRENEIILRTVKYENCKKSELKGIIT